MSNVFDAALNRQSSLEFAPLQFLALFKPYNSPKWGTLEDPTTGDINPAALAGTTSIGNLSKSQGFALDNATKTTKVATHGMGGPSRIIQTGRDLTFTIEAQEKKRLSLELYFGVDLSGVVPTAKGGVSWDVPDLPIGVAHKVLFIAKDTTVTHGQDHYLAYKANKVMVDKVKAIKGTDGDIIAFGIDLMPMTDDGAVSALSVEEFGPGWKPLNSVTDTGFFPVTTLTITPATVTGTVGGTQALTVTDNNSFNVTDRASYATSDPTKATVDAAGVVHYVAAGTATITALYRGVSATKTVTVTA